MKKIIFLTGLFMLTFSFSLQAASSICFSPNGKCDQQLIEFINGAKTSIDVAIYSLTLPGVTSALISAKERDIEVRVLADQTQSAGNSSAVDKLIEAGIPVKYGDQPGLMHNKFTLIDGVRLETGSFNYSANGTSKNAENSLYLDDVNIVKQYQEHFEEMWTLGYSATEYETFTF